LSPPSPLPTDTSSSRTDAEIDKTTADVGENGSAALRRAEQSPTPGPSNPAETVHVTLLSRLRILTANLPLSVPIGRQGEPLACFAVNPENLVQAGQDAWEDVVDPTFNQVIGFGRTTVEIAGFIRRGEYGMDGFCNWTEICLERLHIAPSLLEMRLERVAQAMIYLCVALFILFYSMFIYHTYQRCFGDVVTREKVSTINNTVCHTFMYKSIFQTMQQL
jgi:hypothetical protein